MKEYVMNTSKKHNLNLSYQEEVVDQNIAVGKLRPNESYDNLIKKRAYALAQFLDARGNIKEEFLCLRLCPVCAASSYEKRFNKDKLNVVECTNCHVLYVNPALTKEANQKVYESKEYSQIIKTLVEESHEYRRNRFGKERMNIIERYVDVTLPKTLLEIGCSTGFLLEEAQARGWGVTGTELNQSAVMFAQKRGLKIIDQPLEKIDFNGETFSAVALYDVLEHLLDPSHTLRLVHELLNEKGCIFIYVPNFNSASQYLLGVEHAHFIWPTHHLTYFTPQTLTYFLEQNNFEVLHWETQGLDIEDWLWYLKDQTDYDTQLIEQHKHFFQFAINAAGYGKNFRMYARKVVPHA